MRGYFLFTTALKKNLNAPRPSEHFFFFFFVYPLCLVFILSLELRRCSSDFFPVQQTTYRIGEHVYCIFVYLVRLRPDRLMLKTHTRQTLLLCVCVCVFKRKIRTHPDPLSIPQLGGKNVKTFRLDQRLQIRNLSMAFKRVPRWK